MRWLSLVLLFVLAATQASGAEIGRETLVSDAEAKQWRGVGRINVAGFKQRGMCTGTLIAPDVVLTAAHCLVHNKSGRPYPPDSVHFVAGWHKGSKTGHRIGRASVFHPDWPLNRPVSIQSAAADIALLRLQTPMTDREGEPFTLSEVPGRDEPLTLISYRRDRPHALSRQESCNLLSARGTRLTLECMVTFGASGAPLFTGDAPGVFAVIAAKRGNLAYAAEARAAVEEMLTRLP